MTTADELKNFGAKEAALAAGVNAGTVRAWRANNNLRVGTVRPGRNYRTYELSDVARLSLMRLLTEDFSVSANSAAMLTNLAYRPLQLLANHKYVEAERGKPSDTPEPAYVMFIETTDGTRPPTIYEADRLPFGSEGTGWTAELRVDLKRVVDRALFDLRLALRASAEEAERARTQAG